MLDDYFWASTPENPTNTSAMFDDCRIKSQRPYVAMEYRGNMWNKNE